MSLPGVAITISQPGRGEGRGGEGGRGGEVDREGREGESRRGERGIYVSSSHRGKPKAHAHHQPIHIAMLPTYHLEGP